MLNSFIKLFLNDRLPLLSRNIIFLSVRFSADVFFNQSFLIIVVKLQKFPSKLLRNIPKEYHISPLSVQRCIAQFRNRIALRLPTYAHIHWAALPLVGMTVLSISAKHTTVKYIKKKKSNEICPSVLASNLVSLRLLLVALTDWTSPPLSCSSLM